MIEKEIEIRIKELTINLQEINHFLESAPVGCLKIQQRDGKPYFYHQVFDQGTHRFNRKYISKKDYKLAESLAKKGYFQKIKPVIEKQLIALKKFSHEYMSQEIAYDKWDGASVLSGFHCSECPYRKDKLLGTRRENG